MTGDLTLKGEALARYVSNWPVQVVIRDVPGGRQKVKKLMDYLDELSNRALDPALVEMKKSVESAKYLDIYEQSGEAEHKACKALGVDLYNLSIASTYLWGRSLSDERDARAGADASAQKRGRITRQLRHELLMVMAGKRRASDGDD